MTREYRVVWGGSVTLLVFKADFSQASSPIMIGDYEASRFDSTPFQVADARHDEIAAAKMLNEWLRREGGEAWEKGCKNLTLQSRKAR